MALLSVTPLLSMLNAQTTTYTQPMYEIHWTTHTLHIRVPDSPSGAKIGILQAMNVWNEAQTWFIQTYYPNHPEAIFNLKLAQTGQTAQVTVQYVSSLPDDILAETTSYGTQILIIASHMGGAFGNVVLAAHEIGHVLGLGDNSIYGDLEITTAERTSGVFYPYPSTLDLYGVFLQAKCQCYTQEDTVTLPPQIPYTHWFPPTTVTAISVTTAVSATTQTKTNTTISHSSTAESQVNVGMRFSAKTAALLVVILAAAGLGALLVFSRRRDKSVR